MKASTGIERGSWPVSKGNLKREHFLFLHFIHHQCPSSLSLSLSLIFTSTSLPLSIFCPKANLFIHGRKLVSLKTCTQICPSSKWLHWNYISHESAMRSIYTSISLLSSHNVFSLCLIQYQSVCCSVSPPRQCSLLYINGWIEWFRHPNCFRMNCNNFTVT